MEKARENFERALQKLGFANDDEKLNLWTAYLNFEYQQKDETRTITIFQRALQVNSPKKIFLKMIALTNKDKNFPLSIELCRVPFSYENLLIFAENGEKIPQKRQSLD